MNEQKLMEMAVKLIGEDNLSDELKKVREEIMNEGQNQSQGNEDIFTSREYILDVNLIRVRMKERELTLTQLQEQVGVTYRTVARWLSKYEFPRHQNLMRLAEVLQMEPHQFVRNRFGPEPMENEDLRFVQRRIENMVTEILEDEKIPKDKKLDALIKYHGTLVRGKNSNRE
ncbi:MAG: helix-turn-helix transcriptional regulator [Candidatus Poribacteria bacterium]|nr:helix-turn-helix transcriptional regulator [Candidatus Poribacteria bacterium]